MQQTVLQIDDRSHEPRRAPRRMELFTGTPGRRRWSDELKARIVLESLAPDAVVTQVAQRHGCRPQQIHDWRRLARKRYSAPTFHRLLSRAMIAHEPRST